MKHLVIKHVGPIKDVEVDLNRFNFIIGPQSSGKSTVAKILSTCTWIEKEVCTTLNEHAFSQKTDFVNLVESFHKMNGYFDNSSFVKFETDCITVIYEKERLIVAQKQGAEYYRQKICYIPSERNMVTLPELQGFEFGATNLRSFLFDWFNARENFDSRHKSDILGLGVKYFYNVEETNYKDRIEHENGESYRIPLSNASSGLQSAVPLIIMLQYYSGSYFDSYAHKTSFYEDAKAKELRRSLMISFVEHFHPGFDRSKLRSYVLEIDEKLLQHAPDYVKELKKYNAQLQRLTVPSKSCFIVEEPEQNLFPDTQVELLETMFRLCQQKRKHEFTVTTHSPYIVDFLNVLIMRHYSSVSGKVSLDPNELSVFAVRDGRLLDQMQTNSVNGRLSVNVEDLTEKMREMYTEYQELK